MGKSNIFLCVKILFMDCFYFSSIIKGCMVSKKLKKKLGVEVSFKNFAKDKKRKFSILYNDRETFRSWNYFSELNIDSGIYSLCHLLSINCV